MDSEALKKVVTMIIVILIAILGVEWISNALRKRAV